MKKSLSKTLVEAAQELEFKKATVDKIKALNIPEVEDFSAEEIRAIRERENVSQGVFAVYLNVSSSTVQKWERGEVRPRNAALRLLSIVEAKGLKAIVCDEE